MSLNNVNKVIFSEVMRDAVRKPVLTVFGEDGKMAEIISKIFLLVADHNITDKDILFQITQDISRFHNTYFEMAQYHD